MGMLSEKISQSQMKVIENTFFPHHLRQKLLSKLEHGSLCVEVPQECLFYKELLLGYT